jgi:hypothetical protein
MSITLKRQLNDEEKGIILKTHGRMCFANGHPIPEEETVQFDHIKAYALGGPSELDNIAPMCGQHNKEKGQLPLFDFRTKLRLQEFFKEGDRLTLKHLLNFLKQQSDITNFAQPVSVELRDGVVCIQSPDRKLTWPVYVCPATGWKYFYATLDVEMLDSDDDEDTSIGLQPRYLIFEKVFELFRHFQVHPVLQPSVGRIVGSKIRLFDGQHKIAALLWNGRRKFECKIYLDHDIRLLNQTNIAAHDKYAQTRFFSSVMVLKLGSQFGQDFETYKNIEDGNPKSEAAFVDWLRRKDGALSAAQLNERFRSFLYNTILEDESNKLAKLMAAGNRSSDERPITIDMLQKSIFACFLHREPLTDNLATSAYKRESEVKNMIWLMNTLDELAFAAWNPKAGPNDETQRPLTRLLRSKSMMAWSELLRDAICAKIELHDSDDKARPFYRDISDDDLKRVRSVVSRLVSWKRWSSPADDEIDRVLSDNKSEVKNWLKERGLTTGYLMGAAE